MAELKLTINQYEVYCQSKLMGQCSALWMDNPWDLQDWLEPICWRPFPTREDFQTLSSSSLVRSSPDH